MWAETLSLLRVVPARYRGAVPSLRRRDSRQRLIAHIDWSPNRSGQGPRGSAHTLTENCRTADVGCCDNDFGWDVILDV